MRASSPDVFRPAGIDGNFYAVGRSAVRKFRRSNAGG